MSDVEEAPRSLSDEELSRHLKGRIRVGILGLVALIVAIAVSGFFFEDQVRHAAEWAVERVGVGGMLAMTYVGDVFVTPFTPDLLLVLIAQSHLHDHWLTIVAAMGVASSMGGNTAWWLGKHLGQTRIPRLLLSRVKPEDRAFVTRYGRWGVAAGALTPLPFSLTCWMAGILKLRFSDIWMLTLLRLPRFAIYYLLIRYSAELSSWLSN